ncbi:MAG: hypothetical protein SR3Q1_02145 [Quinella sp. 3Q1]|nr:hypothetical protein [Quinella sp. 3Q1]MBR6888624.1 hypothetical protein [Selenomonadaceae bacterium]
MAVKFDSAGFSVRLDKLITDTSNAVNKKLKAELKSYANTKLEGYPDPLATLETFKNSVSGISKADKDKIPDEVWKAIMEGAVAKNEAMKNLPSLKGLNVDGETIGAIGGYLYGFLGDNNSLTVKGYNITLTTVTATLRKGTTTHILNWAGNETANETLTTYLTNLKTYFEKDIYVKAWASIANDGLNVALDKLFNNLGSKHDGIADSIYKVIKDEVKQTTEQVIDNVPKFLGKTILSGDPESVKIIKNYSAFLKKVDDLKKYVDKVGTYDAKAEKKYAALITAYNNLGVETNIDGLIDKYLKYTYKDVSNGEFTENNASISGTSSGDSITSSGDKNTITAGKGNDTIIVDSSGKVDGGADGDFIVVNGQKNNIAG